MSPTKFIESIRTAFLWSSGADLDILRQVPTEQNKYLGIGGTIIFTALMASFAGGYAFYTAFKSIRMSVFFGMFWGALIFNLDRYIVSTFGAGDGQKTISRQELFEAAPRLLMAIILGFVISTPLELKIFENEIQTKVERLKIMKKMELIAADTMFMNDLNEKKKKLSELDTRLAYLEKNRTALMQNNVAFLDDLRNDITQDLSMKQGELNVADSKVSAAYQRWLAAKRDTTGKYSRAQIDNYNQTLSELTKSRNRVREERNAINEKLADLKKNKGDQLIFASQRINDEIQQIATSKALLNTDIQGRDSTLADKQVNYENVVENYDGFAAHLEALSELTNEKPIVNFAKWMITLMFIFIETAPVLFKMMTERGPYDDLLDRVRHEIKVKQLLAQSNINQEVNIAVKLQTDKMEQKMEAELLANRELLTAIALAQAEIAKKAVENWKEEQIRMMDNGKSTGVS